MKYRNFRHLPTGKWLNVLMTTAGDEFGVPAEAQLPDIARSCGLDPAEVEAVESGEDRRTGVLVAQISPPQPEPEPDPDAELQAALADVRIEVEAATTVAGVKAATLRLLDAMQGKGKLAKVAGKAK